MMKKADSQFCKINIIDDDIRKRMENFSFAAHSVLHISYVVKC